MNSIAKELAQSLRTDASGRNSQRWVSFIVENDIPLDEFLLLLEMEKNIRTRFSWLLGGLVEADPERVRPYVTELFNRRNEIRIVGFDRSVAKLLWLAGVPEQIEGEALEQLFSWIQDGDIKVAVKVYAMMALYEMTKKYPELKGELKLVIEEQYERNSVAFQSRALKVLKGLNTLPRMGTD